MIDAKHFISAVKSKVKLTAASMKDMNGDLTENLLQLADYGAFDLLPESEYENWATLRENNDIIEFERSLSDGSLSRVSLIEESLRNQIHAIIYRLVDAYKRMNYGNNK